MSYSFGAGNVLTAAQMNNLAPIYVIKSADQTITSSTTLTNDSELALTFNTTGITYVVELMAGFTAAAAGDIKIAYARTGTLTNLATRFVIGSGTATTDTTGGTSASFVRTALGFALTTAVAYGADGTNATGVYERFVIRVDVAGTLTVQWAQQASSVTGTVMKSSSMLIATPIAM